MNNIVRAPAPMSDANPADAIDLASSADDIWVAVEIDAQRPFKAIKALLDAGHAAYLPLCKKWSGQRSSRGRRSTRQLAAIQQPLFPGYLFMVYNIDANPFALIKRSPMLYQITKGMDGNRIQSIPFAVITRIRADELAGVHDFERNKDPETIKRGSIVTVMSGAFVGHESVVVAVNAEVATLRINLFGREINFDMTVDKLSVQI